MRNPAPFLLAVLLWMPGLPAMGETIELIDGSSIEGAIQEVRDTSVTVRSKGDLELVVPRKFLTLFQNYRLKLWDLQKGGRNPDDSAVQFEYGQWCLKNASWDDRLLEKAKEHLDKAKDLDSSYGERIAELLKKHGYVEHPTEPSKMWVTEKERHRLLNHIWDGETSEWYTQEEWAKIQKARERDIKIRLLKSTKPLEYAYATPGLIRGDLSGYQGRKVKIWGRVVAMNSKDFSAITVASVKFAPPRHVQIVISGCDCPHLYFDGKKAGLKKKMEKFKIGDRIVAYGMVRADVNRFAIEGVDIVVK